MGQVSRRGLLLGLGTGLVTSTLTVRASATLMRSLSLPALVQGSTRVAVITALAAECHFEEIGRRRRIVTDTRVRIEELIAKSATGDSELLIRTLGGKVGDLGELVDGQAQLRLGQPCVAFLLQAPDGLHYMNGMSQGHYPLAQDSARHLRVSPDLPKILGFEQSAVKELVGRELSTARQQIQAQVKP